MSRLLSFLSCLVCILAAPDADAAVPRIPPAKAAAWVIPGAQVVLYADVGASLDLLDDMLDLAVTLPVLRTLPGVQAEVQELRASLTRELDDARAASGLDLRDKVGMALLCFAVDNAGMINLLLVVRGDYAAPGAIDKLLSSGRVEDYKGKKVAAMPDVELAGGGLMYADKQFLVLGSTHNVRQFIDRKPFGKSAVSAQVAGMPTGTLLGGVTDVESLMGIREVRAGMESEFGRPVLDMMLGVKSASFWLDPKGMSLSVTAGDEVAAEWVRDTMTAAGDYLSAFPLLVRGTGLMLLANAGLLQADLPPEVLHMMSDRKEFSALMDWVYKATKFTTTVKQDKKKLSTVLSAKGDVPALMVVLSLSGAVAWYLHQAEAAMGEEELLRQFRELEEMQNVPEGEEGGQEGPLPEEGLQESPGPVEEDVPEESP